MNNERNFTPPEERTFNPFDNINPEVWNEYMGSVVAIDEVNGGIIDSAETVEALYNLMILKHPSAVFSPYPVNDASQITQEDYDQLFETTEK